MEKDLIRLNASNLSECFMFDGELSLVRMYAIFYDKIASVINCSYFKNIDEDFCFKCLKQMLVENGFYRFCSIESYDKSNAGNKISLGNLLLTGRCDTHMYMHNERKVLVLIKRAGKGFCMGYDLQNTESVSCVENFLNEFKNRCMENKLKKSQIKCIGVNDKRYFLKNMEIKPVENMDINKLYNEDFLSVDKNIHSFMQNDKNGLVILHGEQGTGKTSYIRHLVSTTEKQFVYLPLDVASCLSDPYMITFLCDEMKDAVVIIEDCEQLLVDRSTTGSYINTGLVNILNMADGLIGDSLNLKFICTFNSDIKKIDKALLRKGRLVDKYEFGKLSKEKTTALMKKLYAVNENFEAMTLAEIYNYNSENHGEYKQRKTIGF